MISNRTAEADTCIYKYSVLLPHHDLVNFELRVLRQTAEFPKDFGVLSVNGMARVNQNKHLDTGSYRGVPGQTRR